MSLRLSVFSLRLCVKSVSRKVARTEMQKAQSKIDKDGWFVTNLDL